MKRSKFSEEHIAYALRQAESGAPAADIFRQMGIREATFYLWKKKFAHLGVSELRRLRQIEDGNRRLKQLVADLTLDKAMLTEALHKKTLKPARGRVLAAWFQTAYQVSTVRACRLAGLSRTAWYRRPQRDPHDALRTRIREIAMARPRFGAQRIHVMRRREGWTVNHKRVRRLYRLEGLQVRMRVRRRKHIGLHRGPAPEPVGPCDRWSMDLLHDQLADGRPFRVPTVVDQWSRSSPILPPAVSIRGHDVAIARDRVIGVHGTPLSITVDHGTEFMSRALEDWAYSRGVALDFTRPGKPTDNGHIEAFNGRLRDECLSVHQFVSLADAGAKIEAWRCDYNAVRPHISLGHLTPIEFITQRQGQRAHEAASL
ncbi:MAG: IS3 family transposase [Gemmatimonadales bacterium]